MVFPIPYGDHKKHQWTSEISPIWHCHKKLLQYAICYKEWQFSNGSRLPRKHSTVLIWPHKIFRLLIISALSSCTVVITCPRCGIHKLNVIATNWELGHLSCLVLVIGQPPKEYHADGFQRLHAISMGAGCVEQVRFWKHPVNCFQSSPLSSCSIP